MAGFFSKVDDFVNENVPNGWYSLAAMLGYNAMPTGGASGGFNWLPSGEMTIADGASQANGGTNFLSSLFGSSGATQGGGFIPDLAGQSTYADIGIDPASSGLDINSPLSDPASSYYNIAKTGNQRPWELELLKALTPQQQQQQQEEKDTSMQVKKGQMVAPSSLYSLLSPQVAVKAYRPTLL